MKKPSFGLLVVLLIFSFILVVLGNLGWLGPIKDPLEKIIIPAEKTTYTLTSFISQKTVSLLTTFQKDEKIQKLVDERILLLSQLADQEKLRQENIALKEQLGIQLPMVGKTPLREAKVIGQSTFLILDQGVEEGVSVGDIVVTKNILIGKISQTSTNLSRATLLSSAKSTVKAHTLTTKAVGVVRGDSSGNIIFDNVTLEETLAVDDVVITAGDLDGTGGGFPPNLMVGKIVSVEKKESSLFQKAKIEQAVDLSRLSTVFMMAAK